LLVMVISAVLVTFPTSPMRTAVAGDTIARAISYLEGRQMPDGGFAEPGRSSRGADATTAWCVMALCAAERNPHDVRKNGLSPLDFLAGQAGNWSSVTDYERTLLAATAAGEDPRDFGGVNLVEKIRSFQRGDGRIGDAVNSNAFGIMAYRAAGEPVPPGAVSWLRSVQNPDGGWGVSPGQVSNPDMTAASIMAMRAAGIGPSDDSLRRALAYLRSVQNPDGGFSNAGGPSDTASTAWCVQALVAMGEDPAGQGWSRGGNTPVGFILSMQAPDGHFRWKAGSDMNPVWTTAYAVCALARKPFPVRSPFRSPGRAASQASTSQESGGEESVAGEQGSTGESGGEEGGTDAEERPDSGSGEAAVEGASSPGPTADSAEGGRGRAFFLPLLLGIYLIVSAGLAVWWFLGKGSGRDPLSLGRRLLTWLTRPFPKNPSG